ncbi:MAG TPA: glycerophosphodiester phosphodiesterase family protein [Gemmatimonadales bacterium]|nr:glycerophosphodiester phosphodiesterase family protein [Gemmatimonadales bacterium]
MTPLQRSTRHGWSWTADELRRRWRPIVVYQLLASLAAALVVSPLATMMLHAILESAGTVAVNNYDLVGFFLSPRGMLFLVAAIAVALALFFLLHAGLVLLTADTAERRNPLTTMRRVVRKLPLLVPLGLRQLGGMLLALLPFAAVVAMVVLPLLRLHDINYYLHERPPEWQRALLVAGAAGAGFLVLGSWLAARWSLSVPALLLGGASPRGAMRSSWRLTAGHGWTIVRAVGGWWLLLFGLDLLLVGLLTGLARPLAAAAGTHVLAVFLVVATVMSLVFLLGFVWLLAGHAGHAALINAMYRQAGGVRTEPEEAPYTGRPLSLATVGVALLAMFAGTLALGLWRMNRVVFREDVQVTGHRGSGAAPENSLTAIRQAMAAGADYAEIDVQRTADGAVVVLHDGDLMRLGGDPRKVGDITLAEIQAVDIGARKDPAFAGERVPTLQEVIDEVRGRMKLNIELKYNRPDSLLVPEVLRIVRDNGFTDQATITSLDYSALADVERRAPEFRTGMIITKSVGVPAELPVDFLSVNQAAANVAMLERARQEGKEVHVWTVNTRDDMVRMIELGVDNLITDNPGDAVAVRQERAAMTSAEKMALRLRRVLVQ